MSISPNAGWVCARGGPQDSTLSVPTAGQATHLALAPYLARVGQGAVRPLFSIFQKVLQLVSKPFSPALVQRRRNKWRVTVRACCPPSQIGGPNCRVQQSIDISVRAVGTASHSLRHPPHSWLGETQRLGLKTLSAHLCRDSHCCRPPTRKVCSTTGQHKLTVTEET